MKHLPTSSAGKTKIMNSPKDNTNLKRRKKKDQKKLPFLGTLFFPRNNWYVQAYARLRAYRFRCAPRPFQMVMFTGLSFESPLPRELVSIGFIISWHIQRWEWCLSTSSPFYDQTAENIYRDIGTGPKDIEVILRTYFSGSIYSVRRMLSLRQDSQQVR